MSKLIAGREKDVAFIATLFRHRLAELELVSERLAQTPLQESPRALAVERQDRLGGSE